MSDQWDEAQEAFAKLIAHDEVEAASFITANFVGLMVAMVEMRQCSSDTEIFINGTGEGARDITIHAKKAV